MTDFKADQNYLFLANFFYFQLTDSIEMQPSFTFIEYLNNNPIQQYNVSLLTNFYFEKSFFWFGPYYRTSTSPEAVVDSTTYIYPVVLDRSLTTRFSQTGLLLGYQFSLSDSFSLLTQGSLSQSKYVSPDLSGYTASQVDNFEDRVDLNQSLKMTLTYRQSSHVKYNLSAVHTGSTSKGFQGFTTTSVPVNNYNQLQVLLGVTFKIP
jgi:hypothetical protein